MVVANDALAELSQVAVVAGRGGEGRDEGSDILYTGMKRGFRRLDQDITTDYD
jgi:hypothetical protein